jgi:hypothetical protein
MRRGLNLGGCDTKKRGGGLVKRLMLRAAVVGATVFTFVSGVETWAQPTPKFEVASVKPCEVALGPNSRAAVEIRLLEG